MGVRKLSTEMLGIYFDLAGRAAAAHTRAKGLPGHMRDDLTQDGILWLLGHPERVEHATFGEGEDRQIHSGQIVSEIRRHYVRSHADSLTDQNEDPFVDSEWTANMVRLVFPAVHDPEYTPFREQTEAGERFAERDPAEANTWFALVADVSRALDAYGRTSENVKLLFRNEILGESLERVAEIAGQSRSTVHRRISEALQWMANWLNGVFDEESEE